MKLMSPSSLGKRWKTDGISCVYYDRENRLLTFNLDTLGPVALIQDAHINMPYQSWELCPLDVNRVVLTVTTLFIELQIHIKVGDFRAGLWVQYKHTCKMSWSIFLSSWSRQATMCKVEALTCFPVTRGWGGAVIPASLIWVWLRHPCLRRFSRACLAEWNYCPSGSTQPCKPQRRGLMP